MECHGSQIFQIRHCRDYRSFLSARLFPYSHRRARRVDAFFNRVARCDTTWKICSIAHYFYPIFKLHANMHFILFTLSFLRYSTIINFHTLHLFQFRIPFLFIHDSFDFVVNLPNLYFIFIFSIFFLKISAYIYAYT